MCEVLFVILNMFFSMTPRTESDPICFVLTKLVLTSFFTTKITLLPPIQRQVTIKLSATWSYPRQQNATKISRVLVIEQDIINTS